MQSSMFRWSFKRALSCITLAHHTIQNRARLPAQSWKILRFRITHSNQIIQIQLNVKNHQKCQGSKVNFCATALAEHKKRKLTSNLPGAGSLSTRRVTGAPISLRFWALLPFRTDWYYVVNQNDNCTATVAKLQWNRCLEGKMGCYGIEFPINTRLGRSRAVDIEHVKQRCEITWMDNML